MIPIQVTQELDAYIETHLRDRDPVLARIEREAETEGIPIVGPQEGVLLSILAGMAGAGRLLELGTAVGYSGIWLLKGDPGSSLVTYEMDAGRARRARANFDESGLGSRARVVEGDALVLLEGEPGGAAVCFIDLLNSFDSEAATERAFRMCLERLRPGGLLLADNTLRRSEVLRPAGVAARNVVRYNDLVTAEPRLESVIVPIRDGLSVARLTG